MNPVIQVEKLSKVYRLGTRPSGEYRTLREALTNAAAAPWRRLRRHSRSAASPAGNAQRSPTALWALKDVSFEVQPGEVIGVIGRNGAGKSTLLKVLSRITDPTEGSVRFRGRLGCLLEVGTGFHHELTGRENIYLNGAIMGMSRRQVAQKFDEIVAFAEVEPFLDTPVKRYSSGMFVRLAFAVASHMESDILIVDEVLAVGDAAFQKKCLGKMDEVGRSGRTVLFVSHNMATILNLCQRAVVLDRGRLAFVGPCAEGVQFYTNSCSPPSGGEADLAGHPRRRQGCTPILGRVCLLNSTGQATDQVLCGEAVTIELEVDARCPVPEPHFAVGFDDTLGCRLFTLATYLSNAVPASTRGVRRIACHLAQLPLAPGRYSLTLNAGPREWVWTDMVDQALWFDVTATDYYGNGKLPHPDWGRFLARSRWRAAAPSKTPSELERE